MIYSTIYTIVALGELSEDTIPQVLLHPPKVMKPGDTAEVWCSPKLLLELSSF